MVINIAIKNLIKKRIGWGFSLPTLNVHVYLFAFIIHNPLYWFVLVLGSWKLCSVDICVCLPFPCIWRWGLVAEAKISPLVTWPWAKPFSVLGPCFISAGGSRLRESARSLKKQERQPRASQGAPLLRWRPKSELRCPRARKRKPSGRMAGIS